MKNLIKTLEKTDEKYAVNDKVADLYKEYGLKEKPGVLNNATDMKLVTDLSAIEKLKELGYVIIIIKTKYGPRYRLLHQTAGHQGLTTLTPNTQIQYDSLS